MPINLVLGYAIASIIMIIVYKVLLKKINKDKDGPWLTVFKLVTVAYGLAVAYFFYVLIDWAFL